MNIRINIKDCECQPTIITRKDISEVQFKKKTMLYAPPTKDNKNSKNIQKSQKNNTKTQANQLNNKNQTPSIASSQEEQRKFLKLMSQISNKNQITADMIQNTQAVLQKQSQTIEENQKALYHMMSNAQNGHNSGGKSEINDQKSRQLRRVFEEAADKIARQVRQIKKIRDQIVQYGQNIKREPNSKPGNELKNSNQIASMNENLRNLVQVSKNNIEGLQNLQCIKSLQNFNIEGYNQIITALKQQIIQYQKQSENIERDLKLKITKLKKYQISADFQNQLLEPYEKYLQKKISHIDLHSIQERVYSRLQVFDYSKFQHDVSLLCNEAKEEINDFYIIVKQFKIDVPEIGIDQKQLKSLDLKFPSVLDDFKAARGINFNNKQKYQQVKKNQKKSSQTVKEGNFIESSNQPKNYLKLNNTKQTFSAEFHTKPIDLSKNTKFTKTDRPIKETILLTQQQQQKKQVVKNMKKPMKNHDDEFEKYLEDRARQQLATIYEEKKKKIITKITIIV